MTNQNNTKDKKLKKILKNQIKTRKMFHQKIVILIMDQIMENLLFGEKNKGKFSSLDGQSDPTINYLNGKKLSGKFYELLQVRKSLPAWAAKQNILECCKKNQVVVI